MKIEVDGVNLNLILAENKRNKEKIKKLEAVIEQQKEAIKGQKAKIKELQYQIDNPPYFKWMSQNDLKTKAETVMLTEKGK